MDLRTRPYDHDGVLVAPADGGNGTGVLVLSGSSGRVESERARVLASAGVSAALTYRWFGSPGLPAAIWEYPLEAFGSAVGTRLKYHYKDGSRTGVMDGSVVAREQDRKLTNRFTDKMMDVTVDFDVAPGATPDQTTLTHTITIDTKGLGKVFTPMIRRQLPAQTTGAMAELKRLAESGA